MKSSLVFLNSLRRVWAAWEAGEAGGRASCSGAGRLGLLVSSGLEEPEQAMEASLEDQGGEADARELLELAMLLPLKEALLPLASTAAAAFLTTKGDIIQYLSPCLHNHDSDVAEKHPDTAEALPASNQYVQQTAYWTEHARY